MASDDEEDEVVADVGHLVEAKARLRDAVEALDQRPVACPCNAIDLCTWILQLRALGVPFDDMDALDGTRANAEVLSRALGLAGQIVSACYVVATGTAPVNTLFLNADVDVDWNVSDDDVKSRLDWLAEVASKDGFGRPARHAGRYELVQALLGAAHIRAAGAPPSDGLEEGIAGRRGLDRLAFFGAYEVRVHLDGENWADAVRGVLESSQLPELAARLTDEDIVAAVERLSRRRSRKGETDKWEFLASLVKKAGLGIVSGEALRSEVNAAARPPGGYKP